MSNTDPTSGSNQQHENISTYSTNMGEPSQAQQARTHHGDQAQDQSLQEPTQVHQQGQAVLHEQQQQSLESAQDIGQGQPHSHPGSQRHLEGVPLGQQQQHDQRQTQSQQHPHQQYHDHQSLQQQVYIGHSSPSPQHPSQQPPQQHVQQAHQQQQQQQQHYHTQPVQEAQQQTQQTIYEYVPTQAVHLHHTQMPMQQAYTYSDPQQPQHQHYGELHQHYQQVPSHQAQHSAVPMRSVSLGVGVVHEPGQQQAHTSHIPMRSVTLGVGQAHDPGAIIFQPVMSQHLQQHSGQQQQQHQPQQQQQQQQQQQNVQLTMPHVQQQYQQLPQPGYATPQPLQPQQQHQVSKHMVQHSVPQHGHIVYHHQPVTMTSHHQQQSLQPLAPNPAQGVAVAGGLPESPSSHGSPSKGGQANKRPWTKEEDELLLKLVKTHGTKDWTSICAGIRNRNRKQCRERYKNHLDGHVKKGAWTQEEDNLIFEWQKKVGNKWSIISQYLPNRTDNAVKNRFWSATRSRQRKAKKEAKKRAIAAKAQEIEEEQKQYEKRIKIDESQDVSSAGAAQMHQLGESPGSASAESSFQPTLPSPSPQHRYQPFSQEHHVDQHMQQLPQQLHGQLPLDVPGYQIGSYVPLQPTHQDIPPQGHSLVHIKQEETDDDDDEEDEDDEQEEDRKPSA